MAKKDQIQDEVQNIDVQASRGDPVIEQISQQEIVKEAPLPVEKQEVVHSVQITNPKAALQPGRPFESSADLIGEIDKLIHDAEISGNAEIAGELHSLRIKVGELLSHIVSCQKNAASHVRSVYLKILSFFKK